MNENKDSIKPTIPRKKSETKVPIVPKYSKTSLTYLTTLSIK